MPISVQTKFGLLKHRLKGISKRGKDLKPVLEHIGENFLKSIDLNFDAGGRHSGDPDSIFGGSQTWAPIKRDGQILIDSGVLVGSLDKSVTDDELIVFVGAGGMGDDASEYAARQHYGGGGITARPFMVVQEEDVEDALEDLSKFLINGRF